MRPRHARRVAGFGAVAFVAALLVTVVPLPTGVRTTVAALPGGAFVVVLALFAVALIVGTLALDGAATSAVAAEDERESVERSGDAGAMGGPPGTDESVAVVGAEVDAALARLADGRRVDGTYRDSNRYRDRQTVRESVTGVAVDVIAESDDVSRETASRRVQEGAWTDRPRAAAFLGGRSAAALPLRTRVADWLRGDTFERRARLTVRELLDRSHVDAEVDG